MDQDQTQLKPRVYEQRTRDTEEVWAPPLTTVDAADKRPRWAVIGPWFVAALMVFGVVIRVQMWLVNRPLWLDEQLIGFNLRDRGYGDLIGALWNDCSAPIGWLWSQRFMLEQFGQSELSLRFIPMVSGVATVVASWLVARAFFNTAGALTLTGLAATNIALMAYSAELKHYATDTFFSVTLVGLAMWILREPKALKRWAIWWLVAAGGSLLSMGGFLVVPSLFLVLIVVLWREAGWRLTLKAWSIGLVWFAAFLANYLLALRTTATGSSYLPTIWARGLLPADAGLTDAVIWVAKRFANLSEDPVYAGAGIGNGERFWHLAAGGPFWLLVLAGIVVAWRRRPALGLLLAGPIATAFLLAALRIVPLMARLALWLLPVLFVAVAFALDGASRAAANAIRSRKWLAMSPALALLTLLMLVPYAQTSLARIKPLGDHDDRAGVAWLRENHRPGDLVLMMGNSHRGLDWYGPQLKPSQTVLYTKDRQCAGELAAATNGYKRVLAYAGARISPWTQTPDVVAQELQAVGKLVATKQLGGTSVGFIFDLTPGAQTAAPIDGCVFLA